MCTVCVCAICSLWRADLRLRPSWQMSTIQHLRKTWLAARSLLTVWWKMPFLGLRLQQPLAFRFWLLQACLSASRWMGPVCSRLALLWTTELTELVCVCAHSCQTLHDPMDCSPPGSSVHGILQARILEWIVISSSRGSSRPSDQTHISCLEGILYHMSHLETPFFYYIEILFCSKPHIFKFHNLKNFDPHTHCETIIIIKIANIFISKLFFMPLAYSTPTPTSIPLDLFLD